MKQDIIAVVGLGYVGLPLAVEFGKLFTCIGYDIDKKRVDELSNGIDKTLEVDIDNLKKSKKLTFTSKIDNIKCANIYIITVPTPIDKDNNPDISLLLNASKMIGQLLSKGDIVIYESTVYPGCTEEDCVPILERSSNMKYNKDFFCGYSPERINPGDKEHTLTQIVKVTSGSNPEIANKIDELYKNIIIAGTHLVSSIKVAESAKIIENCQRDINIAFINELAIIFNLLDVDTKEVLDAANTKWNFINFRPGLVGGHCIGIDPYYLTYKSHKLGYDSKIILAGRKLNDNMPEYISKKIIEMMRKNKLSIKNAKILILGITFKENCPDIRNSKVVDLYNFFNKYKAKLTVYDPYANKTELKDCYNIVLDDYKEVVSNIYDGIIISVAHNEFKKFPIDKVKHSKSIVYDLKSLFNKKYEGL